MVAMSEREAALILLDRLLIGADQVMESVDEWRERLREDEPPSLVLRFIAELDVEWYAAPPPDALCQQIAAQVRERLAAWHPGWPHLWGHILRVTGVAVALAEQADVEPSLAYIAGMCHDAAKLDEYRTGDPHEEVGAQWAAVWLRDHLRPSQIESIQAAILKKGGDTLDAILHDADKLDKIGATGIIRRVSCSTHRAALPTALWRVMDDAWQFPKMRFELSHDLSRRKRAFQTWFLPIAEQAVAAW
jgi:hypothetical protein